MRFNGVFEESKCMHKAGNVLKANDTTFSRTAQSIIKPGSPTDGLARLQCVLNSVLSGHYSMHKKSPGGSPETILGAMRDRFGYF